MSVTTRATVEDIVTDLGGSGSGPYTIWDMGGITSGTVYAFITEAAAYLQGHVGSSPSASSSALTQEQVKRFEVNYGSAKLLSMMIGGITVEGFSYSTGGLDVQRFPAKFQSYELGIRTRLQIAEAYMKFLYEWFYEYTPDNDLGYDEHGCPVTYWSTANIGFR